MEKNIGMMNSYYLLTTNQLKEHILKYQIVEFMVSGD